MKEENKLKLNKRKGYLLSIFCALFALFVLLFNINSADAAGIPPPSSAYVEMQRCLDAGKEWKGAVFNPSCVEREKAKCGVPDDVDKYYQEMTDKCWYCYPFTVVIFTAQEIANTIYNAVDGAMVGLIAACFSIWLVIEIISYISVLSQKDIGEFYTDIAKKSVRVIIGVTALLMGSSLWSHTLGPLADGAFDYGVLVIGDGATYDASNLGSPVSDLGVKFVGDVSGKGGLLEVINRKLMELLATGWLVFTVSLQTTDHGCSPFANPALLFSSLPMLLFSAVMLLIIPLKCVDIVYRLAVWLCLLPWFIFSWIFSPFTQIYFQKGVNTLVGVVLNILLLCIIVSLCQDLIEKELGTIVATQTNYDDLKTELETKYVESLTTYLRLIAFLIFSFFVVSQSTELTEKLADTNPAESAFSQAAFKAPRQNLSSAGRFAKSSYNLGRAGASKVASKVASKSG